MPAPDLTRAELQLLSEAGDLVSSSWATSLYNSFYNFKDDLNKEYIVDLSNDGTQINSYLITQFSNQVANILLVDSSLMLPAIASRLRLVAVFNRSGVFNLNVYPNPGQEINTLGTNGLITIPTNAGAFFFQLGLNEWGAIPFS